MTPADVLPLSRTATAWVDLSAAPGSHDAVVASPGDDRYYARTATTIERYCGSTARRTSGH